MHTLRNVEAGIHNRLQGHKIDLEERLVHSVRNAEESAVQRAEDLISPKVSKLHTRLNEELPAVRGQLDEAFSSCQTEVLQTQLALNNSSHSLSLQIVKVRELFPPLQAAIDRNSCALTELERVPPQLWRALDAARDDQKTAVQELSVQIADMERHIEERLEEKWCTKLQQRIEAAERVLRDVDDRARQHSTDAVHTAALIEDHLLSKVRQLQDYALDEAKKYAGEAAQGVREEILDRQIIENLEKRLAECAIHLDARVAATENRLRADFTVSSVEVLTAAEKESEKKVANLAANINERFEGMTQETQTLQKTLLEKDAALHAKMDTTKQNLEAAHALAGVELAGVDSRTHDLEAGAVRFQKFLEELCEKNDNDFSAVHKDMALRATKTELLDTIDHVRTSADSAVAQASELEASFQNHCKWLDKQVAEVTSRCHGAEVEATDAKSLVRREAAALEDEVRTVRAASTSLLHGVLRAVQVVGLLREEPEVQKVQAHEGRDLMSRTQQGPDLSELLAWEKAGRSLSARIMHEWRRFEASGSPSILALIDRKASDVDVRAVKLALNDTQRTVHKERGMSWLSSANPMDLSKPGSFPDNITLPQLGGTDIPPSPRSLPLAPPLPRRGGLMPHMV